MTEIRNIVDRFWEKVDVRGDDECWEWKAAKSKGYGRIGGKNNTYIEAHRLAYMLVKGDIPKGYDLDHLCKNHGCVNPNHLEAVTHKENLLRGNGWAGVNAQKTHCPRGHEYDKVCKNVTYLMRRCSICHKEADRKYRARLKQIIKGVEK